MDKVIKEFTEKINNFNIEKVDLDSILNYKSLSDSISNYIQNECWIKFDEDLKQIEFKKYGLTLEPNIYSEKPTNVILLIKDKITSIKKIESDKTKIDDLNKLNVELTKLYIKYEDMEEEYQEKLLSVYNLIDDKFDWLEDDYDFIKISEMLEKISKEICDHVVQIIEQKRKFYLEYFRESFKNNTNTESTINSEIYVSNFIKNYILNNFNDIFNDACIHILEMNNIKDEKQMKQIISLYYDYTKQSTKLMLSLNDIDYRIKMFETK